MTIFESLHQDDLKVLGSAIRVECAICRGEGRKRDCRHQPRLVTIVQSKVNARNDASILRNIARGKQL